MTVHAMDLSIQLSITCTKDHSARNTRVTGMYTKETDRSCHPVDQSWKKQPWALQVLENGYSRVLNAYTNTTNMEWGGGKKGES